jgi:hypothetical protein
VEWLGELRKKDKAGYAKCAAAVRMLAKYGHELRRPTADILRDGIHELRAHRGTVQYRILYFFHGRGCVVLTVGVARKKQKRVPDTEIDRAIRRRHEFQNDPKRHTHEEGLHDGED